MIATPLHYYSHEKKLIIGHFLDDFKEIFAFEIAANVYTVYFSYPLMSDLFLFNRKKNTFL